MSYTIERSLEVDETMKELILMFQVLSINSLKFNICSVVLLCDIKPACSSSKIYSAWFTSLLRITHAWSCVVV